MLSFFPRNVLDEILDLIESIESVSEGFPTYFYIKEPVCPENRLLSMHIAVNFVLNSNLVIDQTK